MVPYAAYEAHLQGNPHNPKTSQPEPQDTDLRARCEKFFKERGWPESLVAFIQQEIARAQKEKP